MATEITIPSDLVGVYPVQDMIQEALQDLAYTDGEIIRINLAVEEALVNAIRHGNQMDPDKLVHIAYTATAERFDVRIADEGPGFDPEDTPDPTYTHILTRPSGRGLLLMRGFMTEVQYHGRGNVVTMAKVRETAQQAEKS
jgi:serine/threonine-protein kinase RsbW